MDVAVVDDMVLLVVVGEADAVFAAARFAAARAASRAAWVTGM